MPQLLPTRIHEEPKEFEANMTVEQIAVGHQRTVRAIEARAVTQGLMKASARKTVDAFHVKKTRKHK
jgi:hypothetical protein